MTLRRPIFQSKPLTREQVAEVRGDDAAKRQFLRPAEKLRTVLERMAVQQR